MKRTVNPASSELKDCYEAVLCPGRAQTVFMDLNAARELSTKYSRIKQAPVRG